MKRNIMMIGLILAVSWILCQVYCAGSSMEENISVTYGWMDFENVQSILVSCTRWFLPQMILCLFWGNAAEEEIMTVLPYVLTRTKTPWKLMAHVYGKLILSVFGSAMLFAAVPLLTGLLQNQSGFQWQSGWDKMFLWCVYQVMCVVFLNIVSVFVKAIQGLGCLICLEAVFWGLYRAVENGIISEAVGKWLPIYGLRFFDGRDIQFPDWRWGMLTFGAAVTAGILLGGWYLKRKDIV